jgi:hypothetical protein
MTNLAIAGNPFSEPDAIHRIRAVHSQGRLVTG